MNDDAKLHATAQRLGANAAERLDVERTVAAVLDRLRAEPPSASRWSWVQPAWLRIAAALVILIGGGLVSGRLLVDRGGGIGGHAVAHFVSDDLRDLSADQLRDVLTTLDETLDLGKGTTTIPDVDLEDLDAQQLRAVLRFLEG
jgi:hypothetical protein